MASAVICCRTKKWISMTLPKEKYRKISVSRYADIPEPLGYVLYHIPDKKELEAWKQRLLERFPLSWRLEMYKEHATQK